MPNFNIVKSYEPKKSFRVQSVIGRFDLNESHLIQRFTGNVDLDCEWNIGIIVGLSGSGKSTIGKELFGADYFEAHEYTADTIMDDMPKGKSVEEICAMFSNVGFSTPYNWLKPYRLLSNGEKMRVDLARLMLEEKDVIVFDEFTSVVDRNVAKIASMSINKSIKRANKKFVAISCHRDVVEFLQPDWIFDSDSMTYEYVRGKLQRPQIKVDIYKRKGLWNLFRKYHYLDSEINMAAEQFVAYVNGEPAAFSSALQFPHPTLKNHYRGHRTVVLPDYQGIGIGSRLSDWVADWYKQRGKGFISTTSAPQLIKYRVNSPLWTTQRFGRASRRGTSSTLTSAHTVDFTSWKRNTVSFRYCG